MKRHIVCLGDSNTHGYCADPADCADGSLRRFNESERWTCRLQAALGEDFLVLEEGLPGRTTVFDDPVEESLSALPYLYPCLMSHAPVSLLVVMLGTNDTKERLGANACAIGKGLRRLVRKAQSIDCWAGGQPNLLIVAPPAIGKGVERSPVAQEMGLGCVEKSLRLPGQFRAVAAETRCHFLDANALGIGMVHQHFKLVECFSVLDNIILGVEPTKGLFLEKKNARAKVMELSEKYGLMVDPDALISDITVGMQQRTEILKMLYRDNEVLIFDEPTAVLTPQEIDELMKIMKNLAKEGKSILFITHKLNEIMEVADRCTILRKGKYIGTVNISETSKEELSRMMVGRNVSFSVNKKPSKPGDTVLKVEHMTVPSKVHGNNAVKDVSFNVRKGEIVCIAGIDGNGQSEFVQGLTGLEKVSGGKILFNGQDITKASIRDRSKMGMSHIPEDRHKHGLVLDYSIEQNMVLQRYWQPEFETY